VNNSNRTQCERVEDYLERHGEIDPMTALNELGIYRLGARIFELRHGGIPIETRHERVRTRDGGTAVVARYVLLRRPKYRPMLQMEVLL
jgi:hypothetical protein